MLAWKMVWSNPSFESDFFLCNQFTKIAWMIEMGQQLTDSLSQESMSIFAYKSV